MDIPGEPAPSLDPHPSEQELLGYYGPVRQRAPRRYSVPSVSASARSLSRPLAYSPGRGIDARLLTFRARAADQAHAASTPDTAWPAIGYPPGSSRRMHQNPRFRCRPKSFDASTAHTQTKTSRPGASGTSSWSPPDAITPVAVGTALRLVGSGCPPRRSQRARLTHWAPALGSGVKAGAGPRMLDAGSG